MQSGKRWWLWKKAAIVLSALLPLAGQAVLAQGRALFPDPSLAKPQLHAALVKAKAEHKHVLLEFGGDWCSDCHLLDIYFREPANQQLLNANYEVVNVNIGHLDQNLDIAQKYAVPIQKGVPALVVLDADGKVLHEQTHGRFESGRVVESSDLTTFLNTWKPTAKPATKPAARSAHSSR